MRVSSNDLKAHDETGTHLDEGVSMMRGTTSSGSGSELELSSDASLRPNFMALSTDELL